MIIRPATPQDAQRICNIWNPIIRETLITFTTIEKTPKDIETALKTNAPFLVAEQEKTLLGFATYGPFRSGPGYSKTMEISINLAPEARRTGTGSTLLSSLESAAKDNGIETLIAAVSGVNPAAISFHKANKFEPVGTLQKVGQKFGQRLDLVLLQKFL